MFLLALAALIALGLAVEVVRRTMAHRYAASDPASALRWQPNDPEAREDLGDRLTARALASRDSRDVQQAEAFSAALARAAPLRAAAFRNLGLLAQAHGDDLRAEAIMVQAARRGRRDVATQAWLIQQALARRDLPTAFSAMDALLRASPEMGARLYPAIAALLAVPEAPPLLARRLSDDAPPWGEPFLIYLAGQAPAVERATDLFERLARLGHPPGDVAEAALLGRLAREGHASEARGLWLARLPEQAPRGWPYDGDFKGLPGPTPFNWAFHQRMGEQLRLIRTDDDRNALSADIQTNEPKTLADQLLLLSPGPWRLSANVRVPTPSPGAALAIMVSCGVGRAPVGVLRAEATVPHPWTTLSRSVLIPAGCPAQWLTVATLPGDGFGPVAADITHIVLTPASPPA